ncbi:MAG TPA: hypothetical protein VE978_09380 [Chitinophagales bacterium]|nr:hypothetical protein [Chitinophagales bacterium]
MNPKLFARVPEIFIELLREKKKAKEIDGKVIVRSQYSSGNNG